MTIRRSIVWLAVLVGLAFPDLARASNAKMLVVVEIEKMEARLNGTRWNLNNQDEKKAVKRELGLLYKLYDQIQAYEGELNANPCAGAVLDPSAGGPPKSTESTDSVGLLLQREVQSAPGYARVFNGTREYRFAYLAAITDVEVHLLAQLVAVDDMLATTDWNFNNLGEKKELTDLKATIKSALRRLRNSRC